MNLPLQEKPYPLTIGDAPSMVAQWLQAHAFSSVFVLCDAQTRRYCLPLMEPALPKRHLYFSLDPAPGQPLEQLKTTATAERIWEAMLHEGLDRDALFLNLGGGVVGDLGGFCASVFKRGIAYAQLPTTLLAMTDAAIGGKTGVDFQGLKNMLGVFANPAAVWIDPVFLKTLPPRELYSGFAEVIKHALIGSPPLWEKLKAGMLPLNVTPEEWPLLLAESIRVKLHVVEQDPSEKGLRKLLNFGHTVGHALESWFLETPDPLTHGEAIAMGMVVESCAQRSVRYPEIKALIEALYPKRHVPRWAYPDLWARMQHDKKNAGQEVILSTPGETPFSMALHRLTWNDFVSALDAINSSYEYTRRTN